MELLWNPVESSCIGKGSEVRWQRDQETIIVGQMWCVKHRSRKNEIKLQSSIGLSLIWLVLIKYPPGVSSVKYLFNDPSIHGLPWWLSGKKSTCSAGAAWDMDLIPSSGRPPGRGHGSPLQYSSQGNPLDRGVWQVHRFTGLQKRTRLKNWIQSVYFEELWFLHFCAWYYVQIHFVYLTIYEFLP